MALSNVAAGSRLRASTLNAIIAAVNAALGPPMAIVRRVANQVIATGGSGANIQFDTEDADSNAMFTATSDTVTIKTAGKYRATFFGALAGSGQFYQITHNGVARVTQSGGATANISTPDFAAVVNDTVRVGVFQSSGSNQNATGTLSVTKVSD